MAGERARGGPRRGQLFVDRHYYERGPDGGRIVLVTRRAQILLVSSLTLSLLLCAVLLGLGFYGYRLYEAQGARLAALEATGAPPAEPSSAGADTGAVAGTGTLAEMLRSREERIAALQGELAAARDELASAATTAASFDERLVREQEALRLKLEHADRLRLAAETELAASRSRVAALEEELGVEGEVAGLVDETGQPLASLEQVTPADLALLGMELRLVERERDGARAQLDLALERIAALELSAGAATEASQPAPVVDDGATAERIAGLEATIETLRRDNAELQATLGRREAEQAELRATAEATRDDLINRIAAAETRTAEVMAQESELGQRLAATRAARDEMQAARERLQTERDQLQAERDRLAAAEQRLGSERDSLLAERDALAGAATAASTERDALRSERDRLAQALATAEAARDEAAAALAAERTASSQRADSADQLAANFAAVRAELATALADGSAADARLAALVAENEGLATALAAERARSAELAAATEAGAAAGLPAAAAAATELAALAARNRELEATLAAAVAEAETATARAEEANRLAERAASVDPEVTAERDAARAALAERDAEIRRLREDNATLAKASQAAMESQSEAHAAALAELRIQVTELEQAIAARDDDNARLRDTNQQLADQLEVAAATPVGSNGDNSANAALAAANDRIRALEEELAVTARLAAEFAGTDNALPAAAPATIELAGAGDAAELEAALDRIKDLDAELGAARSKVAALEAMLVAGWPGLPRAAPR